MALQPLDNPWMPPLRQSRYQETLHVRRGRSRGLKSRLFSQFHTPHALTDAIHAPQPTLWRFLQLQVVSSLLWDASDLAPDLFSQHLFHLALRNPLPHRPHSTSRALVIGTVDVSVARLLQGGLGLEGLVWSAQAVPHHVAGR